MSVLPAETVRDGTYSLSLASALVAGIALRAIATDDLHERRVPNCVAVPATAACAIIDRSVRIPLGSLVKGAGVTLALIRIALARPMALGMDDAKLALLITAAFPAHVAVALILGLGLAAMSGAVLDCSRDECLDHARVALAPFTASATASFSYERD